MEGSRCFEIPCSILDITNMEHFLEQKAREGYVLERCRWPVRGSLFQEAAEDEYCFHIDLYPQNINEKNLEEPEFKAYVERFERCGWTMRCYYANLVFFCSRGRERPPLPDAGHGDRAKFLKEVTLKAARKQFLIAIAWKLPLVIVMLLLSGVSGGFSKLSPPSLFCLLIICGMPLEDFARYFPAAYRVKRFLPPYERRRFWNTWSLSVTEAGVVTVVAMLSAWDKRNTAFAVSGILLILFAVIISLVWNWKYKYSRQPWKSSLIETIGFFGVFALLMFFLLNYPFAENYRYEINNGGSRYRTVDEIVPMGLLQDELGWEPSDYVTTHENKNHLCRWEWTICSQDSALALFSTKNPDYQKDSRYVGTMVARLKDPGKFSNYLKQKDLNPDTSSPVELSPEFKSWISRSRQEIYHVSGDLVVVHYLSTYDTRTFDIEKEEVKKALRDNLEEIVKISGGMG